MSCSSFLVYQAPLSKYVSDFQLEKNKCKMCIFKSSIIILTILKANVRILFHDTDHLMKLIFTIPLKNTGYIRFFGILYDSQEIFIFFSF